MSSACLHCQQPVPLQKTGAFCCNGCRMAYNILKNLHLESYYKRRTLDPTMRALVPEKTDTTLFKPYIQETDGEKTLYLMIDGLHCAACVWLIETILSQQKGVLHARINMGTRRLKLVWGSKENTLKKLINSVQQLGYKLMPYNPAHLENEDKKADKHLLFCLAIAGFAAANVMLLSAAIWAGGDNMPHTTRLFMQSISGLITLPAVAYAGQPFFKSAWQALKHRHLNMDVPISLAISITTLLSFYETITKSVHETYFDSALMLLFFLLIGRYLDRRTRSKTHSAAEQLLTLQTSFARRLNKNNTHALIPLQKLRVNDVILVSKGERIPVDGIITEGTSTLDTSLMTGESLPKHATRTHTVLAGYLNLENSLHVRITALGDQTVIAEIARLTEESTQTKNKYTRIADRAAKIYAPAVHTLALITFVGWWLFAGVSAHQALLYAVAVLIVTCPCALALAVPVVHVTVTSRFLKLGIILKSATAIERLNNIKDIVFDKTGTLTTGAYVLVSGGTKKSRAIAASLAQHSRHPLSIALASLYPYASPIKKVKEITGKGLEAKINHKIVRLGNAAFCGIKNPKLLPKNQTDVWLVEGTKKPVRFIFEDTLREDAHTVLATLKAEGHNLHLLSGDTAKTVQYLSKTLPFSYVKAQATPQQKHAYLASLNYPMMVGDGINDAPSLAQAHVGVTLGNAADIAKTSADVIIQNNQLSHIHTLLFLAKKAHNAVLVNFTLALCYNAVAIPLAMAGKISPLLAAVFMSTSSLTVMLNALRLTKTKIDT